VFGRMYGSEYAYGHLHEAQEEMENDPEIDAAFKKRF
jgi:hypothetical protein